MYRVIHVNVNILIVNKFPRTKLQYFRDTCILVKKYFFKHYLNKILIFIISTMPFFFFLSETVQIFPRLCKWNDIIFEVINYFWGYKLFFNSLEYRKKIMGCLWQSNIDVLEISLKKWPWKKRSVHLRSGTLTSEIFFRKTINKIDTRVFPFTRPNLYYRQEICTLS